MEQLHPKVAISFNNKIEIKKYSKDKVLLDTYIEENLMTDELLPILAKNLVSYVNTSVESNKLLGIVLINSSNKFIEPNRSLTLTNLTSINDIEIKKILIENQSNLGSGDFTYTKRLSGTYQQPDNDENFVIMNMGLFTGYNLLTESTHKLISFLKVKRSIVVQPTESVVIDYIISCVIKR